jgi:hypothetical protein
MSPETETQEQAADGKAGGQETLTVTDNRTGKTYDIPIEDGTIRARWRCARSRSTTTTSGS